MNVDEILDEFLKKNEKRLIQFDYDIPEDEDMVNRNYKFLFESKDEESNKINEDINKLITEKLEKNEIKKIIKEKYGSEFFDCSYLGNLINYFLSEDTTDKMDVLREMYDGELVKNIYKDKNGVESYRIETTEGDIKFSSIKTYFFDNKQKFWAGNSKAHQYLYEIQKIKSRIGRCHELATRAADVLNGCFNFKTEIVTGYNLYYTDKHKYLHSWNEFKEEDGEEYVIDSTMNVVMNKDGYYILKHMDENQIISRIKIDDIEKDRQQYEEFLKHLDSKTYLTSRDEIIRDLEKNKHLFSKEDGEER